MQNRRKKLTLTFEWTWVPEYWVFPSLNELVPVDTKCHCPFCPPSPGAGNGCTIIGKFVSLNIFPIVYHNFEYFVMNISRNGMLTIMRLLWTKSRWQLGKNFGWHFIGENKRYKCQTIWNIKHDLALPTLIYIHTLTYVRGQRHDVHFIGYWRLTKPAKNKWR